MKLHTHNFSLAGAVFAALSMLLLSIAKLVGIYVPAAEHMEELHMFYDISILGTITGMIEAALITYVSLYVTIWIYNKLLDAKKK